jgi:hypothetical protein
MASDSFTRANESPLASPWGAWGSYATCRLVSNAVMNSPASDGDAGCAHTTSAAHDSEWVYVSGTADGGPAIHCDTGPDGYLMTNYDATNCYMFRIDNGSFTELGFVAGSYVATQAQRLRRSGANVIYSRNGTDVLTRSDSTYTTTGKDGAFLYAGNLVLDSFDNHLGGTAYAPPMDQGAYALTGQAVALTATRVASAAQGAYVLTGQAVGLSMGPALPLAQGAYALTGQILTLTAPALGHPLALDAGSYSMMGSDAAVDIVMSLAAGSYALTGTAVVLAAAVKITLVAGAYALTGQSLATLADRVLPLDQGAYALSGTDLEFSFTTATPLLAIDTGLYSLTGTDLGTLFSGAAGFDSGSYLLTGTDLGLLVTRSLPLAQGAYALTGTDVGLDLHSPAPSLALDTGLYTLNGRQVSIYGPLGPGGGVVGFFHTLPFNWWTK